MSKYKTLCDIKEGETAKIIGILSSSPIKRRLLDIGLTENSTVRFVGTSPLGDPCAFLIRGAVIALRRETMKDINVL